MGTSAITGICQICLQPRSNNNKNGYAYESFQKIPFLGPINEYLRRIRPSGPSAPSILYPNSQQQNSIIASVLPNLVPAGQPQPPPPSTPFSISNLVKQLPSDIMKSQLDILNIGSSSYTRKIKKSNYDQLVNEYRGTDKLYSDPDFLPNRNSLGNLDANLLNSLEWKRLKDIIPNPIFVNDKIEPADILQGSLGDCYLLSALASLAQQEYRIKNVFPELAVNPNGFYMARILHNGILQEVLIDDYFPVRNGKVGFAQPSAKNQIWVMVLQKCWAKLYGSYANIIGGLPHEVLHAFSSAPVFYRPIGSTKEKQESLWAEMLTSFKAGALLCCGTRGDDPKIEEVGFVKGHAYTILGVYDDPHRMIKVRNPWGHKEWKGRGSDYDEAFWGSLTPLQKQNLDYVDSNRKTNTDGVFFIMWEDFITYFQLVDICKIDDNANYNFAETSFQHLTPTLLQFEVGKGEEKNKVTLALTQENLRGKDSTIEERGYSRSFLALGKLNNSTGKYEYIQSNSARTFPDNYMELQNLQSGKYILYAKYLWNNGNASNMATLSTYSASPVVISESPTTIPPLQFLQEIFFDHASRNSKRKNLTTPGDWICNQMLLSNGAFGYLVINIDPKSSAKLSVELNEADFTQKKMEWEPPYRGKGQILEEVNSSKPLIVLFSINNETLPTSLTLPAPKIKPLS